MSAHFKFIRLIVTIIILWNYSSHIVCIVFGIYLFKFEVYGSCEIRVKQMFHEKQFIEYFSLAIMKKNCF